MKIEQLCQSIKKYLEQYPVLHMAMPLAPILLYVFAGLRLLSSFVSLGSLVSCLVYLLFFTALLLTLAECQFQAIAIGSAVMAVRFLISFCRALFGAQYLAYDSLIYLALYLLVAFLAYKKTQAAN